MDEELLSRICYLANDAICREKAQNGKKEMGSTASMLLFHDDEFCLCNIGDSPIFIYRYGRLVEISYEHTDKENVEALSGQAEENKKYKLTQHLGIDAEEMIIEPNVVPGQLKVGDRLLICSDGLKDMIGEGLIAAILKEDLPTAKTAEKLMNSALDAGGRDNVTLICIDVIG